MEFTGEYFLPGKVEQRIEEDHQSRYSFARNYIENVHVLDIACGVGYGAVHILDGGAKSYTGVDINASSVEFAQKIYGNKKATFVVGDIVNFNERELDEALAEAKRRTDTFCILDVRLPPLDRSPALDRLASRLARRLQ